MFLTVFPVSHVDFDQALAQARWINELGSVHSFQALVVHTRRVAPRVDELHRELSKGFASVSVFEIPTEDERGWPLSANHIFINTALHVATMPGVKAWYFFEADNLPTRKTWLTELATEYFAHQKPFMGVINDTRGRRHDTNEIVVLGKHMVGTGIYPAALPQKSPLFRYLAKERSDPFDIYLAWEILPHCHDTSLICHRWCTQDYAWEGNLLTCAPAKEFALCDPVDPFAAAVIHGCKDTSLLDCLRLGSPETREAEKSADPEPSQIEDEAEEPEETEDEPDSSESESEVVSATPRLEVTKSGKIRVRTEAAV